VLSRLLVCLPACLLFPSFLLLLLLLLLLRALSLLRHDLMLGRTNGVLFAFSPFLLLSFFFALALRLGWSTARLDGGRSSGVDDFCQWCLCCFGSDRRGITLLFFRWFPLLLFCTFFFYSEVHGSLSSLP
jgi:hypothetical protein